MAERIALTVNDRPAESNVECSVAAAVMQAHGLALRQSVTGQPRGPLCGMGVCFDCRLTVDGVPHQRSCMLACREGLRIATDPGDCEALVAEAKPMRSREVDVLVIGAGPAGVAAACRAVQAGRSVALVDDNARPGGQIWRHDSTKRLASDVADWVGRIQQSRVEILARTQILSVLDPNTLLAESPTERLALRFDRLILACGARERFLPFPGWTLPGVFGAGGLQALVKAGYLVRGRRVVVAGSGPLLLAVGAYLRQRGADVPLIAEQTPTSKLGRFAGSLLLRQPGKIVEALGLRWQLRGTPYRAGCWPIRADGTDRVESVTLTDGARVWSETCDAFACGFGLVPNLELPMLLGCEIENGFVKVDARQQTTRPGVHAVGELTGIGGLDKALVEGEIAGWSVADQLERAHALERRLAGTRHFVKMLDDACALREDLRHLPDPATIVCRCEDVSFGTLKRFSNRRDAKLQTRAGMGPCQGRICGPALHFLFGWRQDSVRPPIFPTSLGNLLG